MNRFGWSKTSWTVSSTVKKQYCFEQTIFISVMKAYVRLFTLIFDLEFTDRINTKFKTGTFNEESLFLFCSSSMALTPCCVIISGMYFAGQHQSHFYPGMNYPMPHYAPMPYPQQMAASPWCQYYKTFSFVSDE